MSDNNIFKDTIEGYLKPIVPLLNDESVSEVMINSFNDIWIERGGKVEKTDVSFKDEDSLFAAVRSIAQSVGRRIDEDNPRMDARLPNGYRVHVVLPPCARAGIALSIRKFSSQQFTFEDYIRFQTMTGTVAQFLKACMILGKNILISGGTGSGKTSLLGALCSYIPKGQRIIIIEDSSELQIEYEHTLFFETRMADEQGKGGVSIRDLLKSSLRLRPDRIIVGEVRGGEALELVSAMNTGHKGCLGTVHSNSCEDAMIRLEALAQSGDSKLSEKALQQQLSSAIDIVLQVSRYSDGSRKVAEIAEVLGYENGNYKLRNLFEIKNLVRQADGRLKGKITPTGLKPSFLSEMEDFGMKTESLFGLRKAS